MTLKQGCSACMEMSEWTEPTWGVSGKSSIARRLTLGVGGIELITDHYVRYSSDVL